MAEKLDVYVSIHLHLGGFVADWLAPVKYIFVNSQKEKATELKDKIDVFKDKIDRHLAIETLMAQTEKKELDNLMRILGENSPPLHGPCMPGTRTAILQKIENDIKNVNGHSVIWIRGSPGVGKSALAASIALRLRKLDRHVISFRFDRAQSSTPTTDALWRAVALDLARMYPSVRQHIHNMVQGNRVPDPYDIDDLFNSLIETPLSTLNDVPPDKLPVIVVDALDECSGLRHDLSGKDDFEGLVRILKRWVQVDHLKKLKLIITSRAEDRINRIFSDIICIPVDIPSGNDVKTGDSASEDIRTFLKSRLESMGMKGTLIERAFGYLVPRAAGLFIWATTVANFLEENPEVRFSMLGKDGGKELTSLYSLYSTIVKASFGHSLVEEEIRAVVSVIGAMIFSKEPLDDNALIVLPGVKIPGSDADSLGLIRKGLMSVIDSGPVLRFHHRSFLDFLLSPSFRQEHPELSDIQNRVHQEHQLAVLCLKTLVSPKLHFNMCSLESSIIKNVDIEATAKTNIPPLLSYSCQYWADHLVNTPSDETLMEAVRFVMSEKLLFWLEAMSLLGKAHEGALILRRALGWKVRLQFISCNTSLMLAGQTLNPDHELTLFIRDALRFISAFIIPISQSAPQIYVSALSFTPEQSLVGTKFCSRFPNTVVVTEGRLGQWPMTVFTAEHQKYRVRHLVFSHDESIFASVHSTFNPLLRLRLFSRASDNIIICVCDSETGHCISGPFELSHQSVSGACFSPDGRRILLRSKSYAVVLDIETGKEQFRIEGLDFVFIRHDGRIASTHWMDEDKGRDKTRIVVKLWDASSRPLISNRLFEVNDVTLTRFSPDGRFLATERRSESVIELWNLEDGKDPQRFPYPPGDLKSLDFSPTSDSLMAVSLRKRKDIYLQRLDTQGMASFSHYFRYDSHIIHSPLTNYLFIRRAHIVEIWDVSMTGSKQIWEINPPTTSRIRSIRPSWDGHRLLVGCKDGSVKMWELDLENLAMNRADTVDTQADADMPQFIVFSRSGNMVATRSVQSYIEFLDTTTGELVLRTDIDKQGYEDEDEMKIAFSPDEDQVAFLSRSLIIVCDTVHPNNRVSFNPWPREDLRIRKVAFQTCNDLVICASDDDSALVQVWHRQDPTGFERTYSLDFKVEEYSHPLPAPDGLTVVIILWSSSARFYSWNHDTAQLHHVNFDDQVHISLSTLDLLPVYSPDGKLFACWSLYDSHVRVWDTRTGRLVSKFRTSKVYAMALSPTLIEHSPSDRLIALKHYSEIGLYGIYNGHLYAKILDQGSAISSVMVFIRDGTKLAQNSPGLGLRIWDIVDLTDEHWHSVHGYEPILWSIRDGWVVGRDNEPLFWVPVEHRDNLSVPSHRVVIGAPQRKATSVDLSNSRLGEKWTECIDKEWLRKVERKGKEMGNVLEKYVLSSAQVFGDVQIDK